MPNQEFDEFLQRAQNRRAARRRDKERAAWTEVLKQQQYSYATADPTALTDVWRSDPGGSLSLEALQDIPEDSPLQTLMRTSPARPDSAMLKQKHQEMVASYEAAWESNRQEIPLEWWMQYSPIEIVMFGGPESIELAEVIYAQQQQMAAQMELQSDIDQEAERRFEARMRGSFFDRAASATLSDLWRDSGPSEAERDARFEEIRREVELEMTGRRDQLYDEEISEYLEAVRNSTEFPDQFVGYIDPETGELVEDGLSNVEQFIAENGTDALVTREPNEEEIQRYLDGIEAHVRMQIRDNPVADIKDLLDQKSFTEELVEGGFVIVGEAFNKVAWAAGSLIEAGDPKLGVSSGGITPQPEAVSIKDVLHAHFEASREAHIEEIKARTGGRFDRQLMREAQARDVRRVWDEMKQANHPEYQEMLKMAGGDELQAMGFFGAAVAEDADAQKALQQMVDAEREQKEMIIKDLAEQDFRASQELLNLLAMYGRNVPGRLSTAFTIMLTDEDYWDPNVLNPMSDLWDQLGEEAAAADFMPSRALGIDGSLAGLGLDLTSGIAFDPVNWLWGPRFGRANRGLVDDAASAKSLAKDPMIVRYVDDIIDFAHAPDVGAESVYLLSEWMDDVHRFRLYNEVGLQRQVLGGKKHSIKNARWWDVDRIIELLPPGVGIKTRKTKGPINAHDARKLADDLKANNFQEPVTVVLSRSTRSLHVEDGVKRILASSLDDEITAVPVVLKIVDDAGGDAWKLTGRFKGVPDEAIDDIVKVAEGDFGKAKLTGEVLDETTRSNVLVAGQRTLDNQDVAKAHVGTIDAGDGRTLNVFRTSAAADEPVLYVGVDEAGQVQAASMMGQGMEPGVTNTGVAQEFAGKGVATELRKIAYERGDYILSQVRRGELGTMSEAGAGALRKLANEILESAVVRFDGPVTLLEDLLRKGEKLKRPLKEIGGGETTIVAPDSVLPSRLMRKEIDRGAVQEIIEDAIMHGSMPTGAEHGAIRAGMRNAFRAAVKRTDMSDPASVHRNLGHYFKAFNTSRWYPLTGAHAHQAIADDIVTMWGRNSAKANEWLQKLFEHGMKQQRLIGVQVEKMRPLQALSRRVQSLKEAVTWRRIYDDLGTKLNEAIELGLPEEAVTSIAQRRAQLKGPLLKLERELKAESIALKKMGNQLMRDIKRPPDSSDLAQLVREMWEDFNRTEIAPNWPAELVDPETGLVPWERLTHGTKVKGGRSADFEGARQFIPEELQDVAEQLNIEAEKLYGQLSATKDQAMGITVPVSVMDLVGASTVTGKAGRLLSQHKIAGMIGEITHQMRLAWIVDKVMTPATAMVVSFDELLRMFHQFGSKAVWRWMQDRALFTQARARALLAGKNPLSKTAVKRGAEYLKNPRVRERIRKLEDYPTFYKQAERQMFDEFGLGWTDITPDDPHFFEAAQRWSAGMLQDSGFRAFLKGEDAFREWWFTVDGLPYRSAGAVKATKGGEVATTAMTSWEDAYKGWKALFDNVILGNARKKGVYKEVREMWEQTALKIDEIGGRPQELPTAALEVLPAVRGVKQVGGTRTGISRMTNAFFDRLFMDPINYRRGFVADMVRTSEKQRILSLLSDHPRGYKIISDLELDETLGTYGLSGTTRSGMRAWVQQQAMDAGYITESFIDDLVERAVKKQIDHMLYTWDNATRAGAVGRATFPFAKPWADMMGFWTREAFTKPALRGWVNKSNFLWLKEAGEGLNPIGRTTNKIGNAMNWRTPALISRLAHTDFTIDRGFIGEREGGVLPGTEESDFSPLLFLPTGGENPFGTVLPGFGFLPIWGIDMLLGGGPWVGVDPNEDPAEYQALLDAVGDFIPSVHFGSPELADSILRRTFGGGVIGRLGEVGADLTQWRTGQSMFSFNSLIGDISREVDRNRAMSALLSDPEEWDLIFSIDDTVGLDLYMRGLSLEANQMAASGNIGRSITRALSPITNKYDAGLDEIHDVWITASEQFPELLGIRPEFDNIENATEEQIRQFVGDVRGAFFDLSQLDRDLVISGYPQIAINLVATWDWTPGGITAGVPGSDRSYRVEGTREGLNRHQTYVDLGYIRPVEPVERGRRILGLALASKERVAKKIYELTAKQVNEAIWEQRVSENTKVFLQSVIDATEFDERFDIRSAKELWEAWGSREGDLEQHLARMMGVSEEDLEDFEARVRIPTEEKAWGTTWPGLNDENLSQRFQSISLIRFDPDVQRIADTLGITLTPGMNGLQLFTEVQQLITQAAETPVALYVRPTYDTYVDARASGSRAATEELRKLTHNYRLDEDWRVFLDDFLVRADSVASRYRDDPFGVPPEEQLGLQQQFLTLMELGGDINFDWDRAWELKYESQFGPLRWTPPEPRAPLEEGSQVEGAYRPFVYDVIDGDSLVVNSRPGGTHRYQVRLLGVRARDFGIDNEGAAEDMERLWDALITARENGDTIWLVRDSEKFGNVDPFGRELAWLWIGDEPFYFPEELDPTMDPSGSEE